MDIGNPFAVTSQPSQPTNNNKQPQMSQNNAFINQMFGSYNNFQTQFNEFAAQIQQAQQSPQQLVQHLINSGRMSPQQFEALRQQAKEIMERIEDEACRICKKDPLSKDDVMILGQLVDMMKDLSTRTTMDEYSDMYLTPEEYSERWHSMRRGRSPSTGRYTSMRSEPYMDSYGDPYAMRNMGSYNDGYSGHSINDRMIDALERMMDTAKTEHERETIRKRIEEIRRDK